MNKRKAIYTEAPKNVSRVITKGEIIADFLPPPDELIRKEPKDYWKPVIEQASLEEAAMIDQRVKEYEENPTSFVPFKY